MAKLCPSAQPGMDQCRVLGVVQRDGPAPMLQYLNEHVPATENLVEVEERKIDEDRERRRREALEHPMRKALDERFGGTWKDPIVDDVEKSQ